jgi:hypothetical protein
MTEPLLKTEIWIRRFRALASLAALALSFGVATAAGAVEFERPANRAASKILPAEILTGPHYRIREEVVSYGYMHHFTVDSDFGVFKATGDGALRKLLNEIRAIAALKETRQSEAFADSVVHAAKAPVSFGKNLITDPVDTVSGLPKGVFQIFGNVGEAITMTHDPSEDSRVKQALFVSSWKRDYCAELGCDVYSSNAVLQEELNSVGWAAAIGGLTVSAVTMPAKAPAVVALKQTRLADQIGNALKEEPPSRLRLINQEKLSAMGVSEDLAERFLDHPQFTPRHDTILVGSLAQMKDTRGREAFLEATLAAEDETSANFFMNIAQTLRGYYETVSPVKEVTVLKGFTLARAENGRVLMPFPLDHGVWSERASQVIGYLKSSYQAPGFTGKFDLWVTGTVSPLARQQLEQLGFEVAENVDQRIEIMD